MRLRSKLLNVTGLALALLAPSALAAEPGERARPPLVLPAAGASADPRVQPVAAPSSANAHVLGLLQEVEALKLEVAKLRGQAEVQSHQMETLGKRQNDLYIDLDQRLSDLAKAQRAGQGGETATAPPPDAARTAPVSSAAPGSSGSAAAVASAPAAPASDSGPAPGPLDPLVESRTYEASLSHFRDANYPAAIAGFKGFLKAYPNSSLAPNAQYWIGYSHYALKDYKTALAHQQKLLAAYPTSAKVPDAMLNVASNMIALDDLAGARKVLEELVARHPGTNAAELASRRLTALK